MHLIQLYIFYLSTATEANLINTAARGLVQTVILSESNQKSKFGKGNLFHVYCCKNTTLIELN